MNDGAKSARQSPSDRAARSGRAERTQLSRHLSLILRHDPGSVGLQLDAGGWVSVADLVNALVSQGHSVTVDDIDDVVHTSDKQRFTIDSATGRIRANQGHSVLVDLGLTPVDPPAELYHGTVEQFLVSINREGLVPGERQFVHLSADVETALKVGARRGKPVVLTVGATDLQTAGHPFYRSVNGVWLVDAVPPEFLRRYEG